MQTSSHAHSGRLSRVVAATSAAVIAVVGIFSVVPAAQADTPETQTDNTVPSTQAPVLQRGDDHVTSDSLPTVQINDGYVWAQTTIGTTVYAGGQFSNVRPSGAAVNTNLTPRNNILAYDITTGNLITSFAPTTNGPVKAVAASPDGTRIYIGGSFNRVNGQPRHNFAVLNAVTGELVSGMEPAIGGSGVFALAATNDAVYIGGLFTQANGVARTNLAAISPSNGALLPWAPTADLQVDAMVMEPQTGNVVVGGRFYAVNSQIQRGIANLDPVSGAINTSWDAPNIVQNGWSQGSDSGKAGIFGLATDSSGVYGTGWVFANASVGNLEGAFAADAGTGNIRWVSDCHGDHYGIYSSGSVVYTTDHTHQCETVSLWPDSNPRLYRYVESYTTQANGTLTRSSSAGSTYKDWSGTPSPSAYNWFPDFTVGTTSGLGQAGLSITGADGFISIGGEFGTVNNLGQQGLSRFATKANVTPKQGPRVATANWVPSANSVTPGTARITIPANWDRDDLNLTYTLHRDGGTQPVATKTVASSWWNLPQVSLADKDLTPGSTHTYTVKATDADGNSRVSSPVTVTISNGTPSRYADAVLDDGPSLYYRLGGNTQDWAGSNNPLYGNDVTTTTPGGVTDANSAASVFTGSSNSRVSSTATAPTGSELSQEVWFKTTTTRGGMLLGYGNSQTGSSSNHDRHVYMTNAGKLMFGVYPGSAQTISSPNSYNDGQWHHVVSTLSGEGMKLYVDGVLVASKASVTSAQPFTGYWRIGGDNLNGWPSRPSSDYFAGQMNDFAIYPSVLSPETIAAHYAKGKDLTAPTAAFAANPTDVQVAFDASASSAAGSASISSYAWDFGDEKTGSEGPTTTHTYAAAGTYQVKLTVTDSNGMTGTSTKSVTVTAPPEEPTVPGVIASDNFNRQIASGWGTADTGGAWTTWTAVASRASVNNGSGKISLPPGYARNLVLRNASPTDSESSVQFSVNGTPAMGDAFAGISARMTDSTSYTVRARMKSDGTVWLVPRRGSTNLPEVQVPGVTWSGNEVFNLKMRVTGTKPTKIEARIWKDGSSEPSVWQLSRTDATAALQSAGYVGLHAAHASGTPGTIEVLFDSFRVVDLGQANN